MMTRSRCVRCAVNSHDTRLHCSHSTSVDCLSRRLFAFDNLNVRSDRCMCLAMDTLDVVGHLQCRLLNVGVMVWL